MSQRDGFLKGKQNGGNRVGELQDKLNEIKGQLQEGDMERKVMLSMIKRLKADKIYYDQQRFDLQKMLTQLQKDKNVIDRESKGINE